MNNHKRQTNASTEVLKYLAEQTELVNREQITEATKYSTFTVKEVLIRMKKDGLIEEVKGNYAISQAGRSKLDGSMFVSTPQAFKKKFISPCNTAMNRLSYAQRDVDFRYCKEYEDIFSAVAVTYLRYLGWEVEFEFLEPTETDIKKMGELDDFFERIYEIENEQ